MHTGGGKISMAASTGMLRLAERLELVRRQRFVGRKAELELFHLALETSAPPFALLYLYGPGGVGKTTLLREYAHLAREHGRTPVLLDGRNFDPSPAGLLLALQLALNLPETGSVFDALAGQPRLVLLIDTCETLSPLDGWLRNTFLPQLPEQALVVLAGRNMPAPAWRTDSGWSALTRIVSLRNLRPEESQLYLAARGVPEAQQAAALSYTHGYPLALSLVADVLSQSSGQAPFDLRRDPDTVRVLLERFVRDVPNPPYRQALEICAHARTTTEAMLANTLGETHAAAAFDWLRDLSFIELGPYGLFPHDLAREVLEADLRWRNPERFHQVHLLVRRYIIDRIMASTGLEQQHMIYALLYLHRNQPFMKPFYEWQSLGQIYADPAQPEDWPQVERMVRKFQGEKAVVITRHWLQQQPQGFFVFRAADRQVVGFAHFVDIGRLSAGEAGVDPAIQTAMAYIERYGPPRPGEAIYYFRNWMGRDDYQQSLSSHNMAAMICLRTIFAAPRLAWTFITAADPDFYQPMFNHIRFCRVPEADFEVDGQPFGVFAHDWRAEAVLPWLEVMGEREITEDYDPEERTSMATPLVVLSEPEFAEAVRQALRDYSHADVLAHNPLLRSRLLRGPGQAEPGPATLQAVLRQAAETLTGSPKDQKLYRALWSTYFDPAPSQEQAAELLNLPFSTYRYHLGKAIERLTAWLWQQELYGSED